MTRPVVVAAVTTVAVLAVAGLTSGWGIEHVWRPVGAVISDAVDDVPGPATEGGRGGVREEGR